MIFLAHGLFVMKAFVAKENRPESYGPRSLPHDRCIMDIKVVGGMYVCMYVIVYVCVYVCMVVGGEWWVVAGVCWVVGCVVMCVLVLGKPSSLCMSRGSRSHKSL